MTEFKVTFGNDPFVEVTEYFNKGFAIILESTEDGTTTCHRVFHNCKEKPIPVKAIKIIYIDFSSRKDLIAEWTEKNYKECSCNVEGYVGNSCLLHKFAHIDIKDIVK
jgi:hypothetical protein